MYVPLHLRNQNLTSNTSNTNNTNNDNYQRKPTYKQNNQNNHNNQNNQKQMQVREVKEIKNDDNERNAVSLYPVTLTYEGFKILKNKVIIFNEFKTLINKVRNLREEVNKSETTNRGLITDLEKKCNMSFTGNEQTIMNHINKSKNTKELLILASNLTEYKTKVNDINNSIEKINELKSQIESPFSLMATHTEISHILIDDEKNGWNVYDEISDYKVWFCGDNVTIYSKRKYSNTQNKYFDIISIDKSKNTIINKVELILKVANIFISNNNISLDSFKQTNKNNINNDDDYDDINDDIDDEEYVIVPYKRQKHKK